MSSSIDNLFGPSSSTKTESSVDKLFSQSSGPIDDLQLKAKIKSSLPQIRKKKVEESKEGDDVKEKEQPLKKKQKKSKDDEDDQLENRYFAKLMDEDDEEKKTETVSKEESKEVKGQEAKRIDLKEDELEKAERTVFVGNILNGVITSKNIYKEFKKLFSTDPSPKEEEEEEEVNEEKKKKENAFIIDSIRFRSISFEEALPRKVAFVQQKLHKSRDSVNAYIVYKNKSAVTSICSKLNGLTFHDRHLRVDSVTHPAPHDKKRSVFVGNLDFEEDEESLWVQFQSCGEIEYVRIVRDSKTNMGKGFAYIQFKEIESVNKALLLNDQIMKSINNDKKKGRKLRVTRCKNMKKGANSIERGSNKKFAKLNEQQRTKMGRAKKVLSKADKATLGKELTIEGLRATKGEGVSHLKKKKQRSKTGRVTKRSIAFKKANAEK